MLTRPQEDKDLILKNLEETYYIENFVSKEDIQELCDIFNNSDNKVYKKTGPITSTITDFKIPVMRRITDKIHNLYPNCEIYHGMYFYVDYPHIIHNDDNKEWPLIYKAFNIPLKYEGNEMPYLCFFDQVYLDGPSKFFNGEKNVETHYNTCVYDYKDVLGKSKEDIDNHIKEKYLTHLKDEWLKGLSFNSAHHWKPGNTIVFDSCRLHCASDFRKNVKSKLGISIFTKLKSNPQYRLK